MKHNHKKSNYARNAQKALALFFGIASRAVTPKEAILVSGRYLNAAIEGRFIEEFKKDFVQFKNEFGVRKDIDKATEPQSIFASILRELEDNPDEIEKLKLMKKLFFISIRPDSTRREVIFAHQFNQKVRKMSSMEIMVLRTIYKMLCKQKPEYQGINDTGQWLKLVAKELGGTFTMEQLVSESEGPLVQLGTIHMGRGIDKNHLPNMMRYFRLTEFGLRLCFYVFGPHPFSKDLIRNLDKNISE